MSGFPSCSLQALSRHQVRLSVTSDVPISLGGKDRARNCHSDWPYQDSGRSGQFQAKWLCLPMAMGIAVAWANWVMLSPQDLMSTESWQHDG